jgi:hypothetical protein
MFSVISLALAFLALTAAAASPQEIPDVEGRRTMTAVRMSPEETITLDGRLDEPIWQRAVPATDFIQQQPRNGAPPTERTEVRIVYSRDALYVGVTNYDSEPDKMLGNTMKRDEFLRADDRFMWVMNPMLDNQSGYFFEMNPSGLMADSLMNATGAVNREWDGIWNARVQRSDIGWTIELEMPFRTLNFNPNVPGWGINFQRSVRRKNEESLWTGHGFNQGLWRLSNAGLLTGISDVGQGKGLDIKPYARTAAIAQPGRNDDKFRTDSDVGLDVFYSLTPRLRANFTVNTDFAQTEVDQRQVNLTRFSLFFPEKRDFFLVGAASFDFATNTQTRYGNFNRAADTSIVPFFTRRIGLKADGVPQAIDFGTKVTGRAGAQDIGVLHVRTGEETGVLGEDFTVMRIKRNMLAQSYIGGLYTRRAPRLGGADDLHTIGIDARIGTARFRGSQNLEASAFYLNTSSLRDTGKTAAFGASIDYPNDKYGGGFSFREVQENYDPALGFTLRQNYRRYTPFIRYAPRPRDHPWILQWASMFEANLYTDPADNQWLTREMDLTVAHFTLQSQDVVEFHVRPTYERLERPFVFGPGIALPMGGEYDFLRYKFSAQTANRRVLALGTTIEVGDFYSGTRKQLLLNWGIRPRPGQVYYIDTEWNRVELFEGSFTARLYRFVADNQFNPFIAMTNNFQYDSVSGGLGWQGRFRWIMRPGNDFYFVYNHNWQENRLFDRFQTLDRGIASKIVYTHQF